MRVELKLGGVAAVAAIGLVGAAPAQGALECGGLVAKDRKLTRNLDCPPSTTALTITADGVTLDLNGHTLRGSGAGSYGVLVDGVKRTEVVNGTIRDFDFGIQAVDAKRMTLSRLEVRDVTSVSLKLQNVTTAELSQNELRDPLGDNINVNESAEIRVRNNRLFAGGLSMSLGADYVAAHNRIIRTNGIGIGARAGISIDGVIGMEAENNYIARSSSSGIGISSGFGVFITGNEVRNPLGTGIGSFGDTTVLRITRNDVRGAESHGVFVAEDGARIRENRVLRSGGDGIANEGPTNRIKRNVANDNFDYGIQSVPDDFAENNTATGNGNPAQCTPATACN